MGASGSSSRRRRDDYYPPPPPPAAHHYPSSYPPPPPPPPHHHHHHHPPPPHHHRHPAPPPPPPPASSSYYYHHPPPPPHGYHGPWHPAPMPPPQLPQQPPAMLGPPPEFVEHQQARKVKNAVNLHKDTIRLVPDDADPDRRLVAFTFDAITDGSVTIYYFAKEEKDCSFASIYPELQTPAKPFQKGLAQRFIQPSGSGVDLGFFSLDELSNPSEEVFPLVVYAEAYPSPEEGDELGNSTRAQITLAVIDKHNDDLRVKVVKQILWIDGVRYELQEIFGMDNSTEADVPNADDNDTGKECVICLTEPRDTAVIPCRHLCMCSECAKALRFQSNKCPICRQPVEKLMEIKVQNSEL
ncbi:hypothetical protein EJB05_35422, partial [Eragrostis curvula]